MESTGHRNERPVGPPIEVHLRIVSQFLLLDPALLRGAGYDVRLVGPVDTLDR